MLAENFSNTVCFVLRLYGCVTQKRRVTIIALVITEPVMSLAATAMHQQTIAEQSYLQRALHFRKYSKKLHEPVLINTSRV